MRYSALLKKFEYLLPLESIALKPAKPRDQAQLLVYDRRRRTAVFDRFFNLDKYLPANSVLVLNDTKVVPARLMTKFGRASVELFYVGTAGRYLRCLANHSLEKGTVLRRGPLRFKIMGREERWYLVKPSFSVKKIFPILDRYGRTPLPPYLESSPLTEKKRRAEYQTVFAAASGSVAAPTASLHFTDRLLKKIEKAGVKIVRVTLHVNLGTFAPLADEQLDAGRLHAEEYEITPAAAKILNAAKRNGQKVVAVGTTACRALEAATDKSGRLRSGAGITRIFIRAPYCFKFVDALITNFHVPRSSLLMLVAALVGREKLLKLYALALDKRMKFLSFGDGMLIL